jgi:hypothetical protein
VARVLGVFALSRRVLLFVLGILKGCVDVDVRRVVGQHKRRPVVVVLDAALLKVRYLSAKLSSSIVFLTAS